MSSFTFTLPPLVDVDQLRSELAALGVPGLASAVRSGATVQLTFDEALVDVTVDEIQAVITAHRPDDLADLDQLVAKARDVWSGSGTFTPAQAQKILAGLVLVVARYLR